MGRTFGFITMLATVVVGFLLYSRQTETLIPGGEAINTAVDMVAVRNDLIGMANAERRFWASKARYGTLAELRDNGDFIPTRPTFTYSAEPGDNTFKIIATYSGKDPKAPKRLSVNEAMRMETEP